MKRFEGAAILSSQERYPDSSGPTMLENGLIAARDALLSLQKDDGHWCFPLEADCSIPAEYVLMMHFMDDVDVDLESGSPGLFVKNRISSMVAGRYTTEAPFDLSCTVKAYYALKIVGDSPDAPHMVRARAAILKHGGAARANVFTRILLAMYGQIPWRGVPFVPVEIILLPRWFPFHISKVAYWSRTVMIPLSILCSLKARAVNPRQIHIQELFTTAPRGRAGLFSRTHRSQPAVFAY